MSRNVIKILEKDFSDMKAGMRCLSHRLKTSQDTSVRYLKGVTPREMRFDLAREKGADNSCPVSTGIFLRMAIEDVLRVFKLEDCPLPFWRVVDETHPVLKKLGIPPSDITRKRQQEIPG